MIELLVVIAVIVILAAILIPVVGSVRKRANMVTSVSNIRQIGVALQLYTSENNQRLPQSYVKQRARMRNPGDGGWLAWTLAPYLSVPQIVGEVNPFFGDAGWAASLGTSQGDLKRFLAEEETSAHRYILNRWHVDEVTRYFPFGTPTSPYTPGYNITKIEDPSKLWAMQDIDAGIVPGHPLKTPLWGDKRLALYFDWHVDTIPSDQFFVGPLPKDE